MESRSSGGFQRKTIETDSEVQGKPSLSLPLQQDFSTRAD